MKVSLLILVFLATFGYAASGSGGFVHETAPTPVDLDLVDEEVEDGVTGADLDGYEGEEEEEGAIGDRKTGAPHGQVQLKVSSQKIFSPFPEMSHPSLSRPPPPSRW